MSSRQSKTTKRRTQVKQLPKTAKKLPGKEMKKVKGGLLPYVEQDNIKAIKQSGAINVAMGDGSVRY